VTANKPKKSTHRMFLDDVEYLSFMRRLSWSPDGTFFLTPASVYQDLKTETKNIYTVYGFLKSDVTQPAFMLPGIKSYATCIRFSPYLYKPTVDLRNFDPEKPPLLDLPYRVIFAVGTTDQVIIYSSESTYPIAVIGNAHYATINDIAWIIGTDGSTRLSVASSDGFVSFITFDVQENGLTILGERLPTPEVPEKLRGIYEALD